MEKETVKKNLSIEEIKENRKNNPIGYPLYPNKEDVYNNWKEETDIDPENISKKKISNDEDDTDIVSELSNEGFLEELDVPGSELDDYQENIGNEDEENNYYSIGGDDHNNLEENNDN